MFVVELGKDQIFGFFCTAGKSFQFEFQVWTDYQLNWNSTEYGGVDSIRLEFQYD